jgi:betaine-aldehyde dehydrogenase
VLGYIAGGVAEGAMLANSGKRPDDPAHAHRHLLQPAVFTGVTHDMMIAREEIFGPVLAVLRWEDEARMLAQVNDTEYGLTASIWTNDPTAAHRLASRIEAGYVWINEVGTHFLGASFGGMRQSGIGREESIEELFAFTREKHPHPVDASVGAEVPGRLRRARLFHG